MLPMDSALNSGDTAWILTSSALVLLMTPGLALFYGGMVRAKSVLNMMMMSFGALALIGVLWVLWGYSMAFGNDVGGGLLGNPAEYFGLTGLMGDNASATYPAMAFVAFQAVFAIITVALISGAIADRARSARGWSSPASGRPSSTSPSPTGCSPSTPPTAPSSAAGSPTR